MQGLILINKPKNISSFGAVHKIKKLTSEKRVGHTGTLDPMATGVLPIFIGRATVLSTYLLEADKSYLAKVKLGVTTDTFDKTGKILKTRKVDVTTKDLDFVLSTFVGEQMQTPPMFSALKKEGKKLYELARQGYEVEREPRCIRIHSIKRLTELSDDSFRMHVSCSKGTYIRTLCNDIGNRLGCGAILTDLCRDSAHGIDINQCVFLEELTQENIMDYILPEELAVSRFEQIKVTEKQAIRFSNGGELDANRIYISKDPHHGQLFRIKYNDLLLGIGRFDAEKNAILIDCIVNQYKGEEKPEN